MVIVLPFLENGWIHVEYPVHLFNACADRAILGRPKYFLRERGQLGQTLDKNFNFYP